MNVCVEAVGLDAPNLLGSAVADAGGVATITRFVPGEASGRTVVLQAVEASTCKFSNVVTFTFP